MPKIREITVLINNALKAGNFKARPFQTGNWMGLATILSRTETQDDSDVTIKRPVVVDITGDGVDVSPDDKYPIQFYHRLVNPLSYPDLSKNDNESFGQPNHDNKEVADMVMICIGSTKLLKVFAEDICAAICVDMPKQLTKAQLVTLKLENCDIDIVDTNTNSEQVFNQEFSEVDFDLVPENFMIAVRYTITTIFSKSCLTICN